MSDNELIAEFMGIAPIRQELCVVADGTGRTELTNIYLFGYTEKLPHQMQYKESWDWLMPVVERVESIYDEHHGYFQVHISSNSCDIQGTQLHKAIEDLSEYGWVYMSDPNAILESKIASTYYNVVEFIKWYNQQTK